MTGLADVCADVCLEKSFLLRTRKSDTRWLVRRAIGYLPLKSWNVTNETRKLMEGNLRELLARDIREKYGNPIIIFILLRIILPIVVRFVIEWWLNWNEELCVSQL